MALKFLSDIHATGGTKDSSGDLGTDGQVLSSTGSDSNWVNPTVGTTVIYKDAFTATNNQTAFTLANTVDSEDKTQVYIDGAYQSKGGYSVSGTTLTFDTGLVTSSAVEVMTFSTATANNAASAVKIDTFTGDGSDLTFVLDEAVVDEKVTQVYINGVYQNKSTYSIAADLVTLTFGSGNAPPNSTAIEVISFKTITSTDGTLTATTFLGDLNGTINTATTATTQSAGNNTTKIATTAFVTTASNAKVADAINNGTTGIAPSQNAVFDALALKSNIAGPTFTGTPAAPTASAGTNTTQLATTAFVTTGIANIVDSSPGALNTLNELAAALGDDANFSTTITNSIALKAPLASPTFSGTVGMNVAPASTRTLLVKGQGTSSSTAPFQVNDGNNADILVIKDDKTATFSGEIDAPTASFTRLEINATNVKLKGDLLGNVDGAYDIGASGANRPRNLYLSNSIQAADITTTGNVQANGGIKVSGPASHNTIQSANDYTLGLNDSNGTNQWWLKSYTNGDFALHENAVGDKFTVKAGGNVGIGTASPNKQLTFVTANDDAIQIRRYTTGQGAPAVGTGISWTWTSSGTDTQTWAAIRTIMPGNGNTHMTFSTRNTAASFGERMRITDAGALEIKGSGTTVNGNAFITNTNAVTTFGSTQSAGVPKDMAFYTGAERMRIKSDGEIQLGIGSYTSVGFNPNPASHLGNGGLDIKPLTVPGSGTAQWYTRFASNGGAGSTIHNIIVDGNAEFGNPSGTGNGRHLQVNSLSYNTLFQGTSTNNILLIKNGTGLSANVGMIVFQSNGGNASGQITTNSATNTTAYNTSGSDERLKKNITDWDENVLDKFKDIQPKEFHFKTQKDSDKKAKGYLAQNEVDKFPEAYPLVEDKESGEKRYQFNPSGMNVYLMKAIQEQQTIIQDLKSRIETLEG